MIPAQEKLVEVPVINHMALCTAAISRLLPRDGRHPHTHFGAANGASEEPTFGVARELSARPSSLFRAQLCVIGAGLGDTPLDLPRVMAMAARVELLHLGSLVLDDLADGDTERRGRPAAHCLWSPAIALNAGGWMTYEAMHQMSSLALSPTLELELLRLFIKTANDCHCGQAMDLALRPAEIGAEHLYDRYLATIELKSGAGFALPLVAARFSRGSS